LAADGDVGEPRDLMLMLRALLKLHFLDGVFGAVFGAPSGARDCDGGGENTFAGEGRNGVGSTEIVLSASTSGSSTLLLIEGKTMLVVEWGGERKPERSLGSGGTGGTISFSNPSPFATMAAARSRSDATSLE
jgi:hypothetical protein